MDCPKEKAVNINAKAIQNSKRGVSRVIVASGSLLKIMEKYYNDYCTGYGQDGWLIQNSKGGAYCKATLYKLYHELLGKAGI